MRDILRGDAALVGNLGQLTGSGRDGLYDTPIDVHIAEFLREQVIRLLVEISRLGEVQTDQVLVQTPVLVKKRQILGDASRHTVDDGLILPGPRREKGGNLPVVQRFQPELHGAAAEQRALLAQYLVLHETDRGTADDEEHIAKLPLLVNGLLQRGGDHAALFFVVRKLVDHNDNTLVPALLAQKGAQIVKGREYRRGELRRELLQCGAGKELRVSGHGRLDGREKDGFLILAKLAQQRGFADAPSAIDNSHLKSVSAIGVL